MDANGSVLESRVDQDRAVEQFLLPTNEALLCEVENREKEDAIDRDHVARIESKKLQSKLNEEVQEHMIQIAHMESKAFETVIIERYRDSYLGKVVVALTCKVRFDYLKGHLPPKLLVKAGRFKYPS
ncbi:uncharacterized protein A4U43_C08F12760 [Asparagus officinalis]|nr:uncharacterized protein A4U43_C08F12760 [Asparagus officinalis]